MNGIIKTKKGFTLVELIAVIILVGVIALISIPTVNLVITKSKERARTAQIKTIESAAKSWASENLDSIAQDKPLYIKVEDLIIESYLDEENIVDPLNEEKNLDQCVVVIYNEEYKKYDYIYTSCTDDTVPTVSLSENEVTTSSISVTLNCLEEESLIVKHEFSIDNGITWINQGQTDKYEFKKLVHDKSYGIMGRCTNSLDLNATAFKTVKTDAIEPPMISQESQIPTAGTYATSRTIKITYPLGYVNEYSTDLGVTWNIYDSPIVFNANGTVIARVNDGINYVNGSSYTVTNIDTTKPAVSLSSSSVTSKSVNLFASCVDNESGITKYEFSKDNGTTYVNNNTTNTYTFNNLTTGSYTFKVRCTNGIGFTETDTKGETTTLISVPTYSITPSGYATSKTVTITYPSGYTNEYSTDGGTTWTAYTTPIVFNANGTVIARVNDGVNYVTGSSFTVTNIDTTAPTGSLAATTVTSKSVLLTATCADAQSGITKYEFSKDNGTTYVNNNSSNTYMFNNLTTGTYSFRVRCTNGSGLTLVASRSQATTAISTPTYSITPSGYATSKTVTITYPSGYTNEYSTDGGTTWTSYTAPVVFNANGTIIARVNDGLNYVSGSSFTVTNIDTTAPTGSLASGSVTSKSVTLTATCADAQSGITKYEFSKDNGTTYLDNGTTNTYTYNSLTTGTYSFRVRCTNGSGLTVVASRSQATSAITVPTYSITPSGYATSKTVTITYPSGYTNEYSTDGGTTWTSYTAPVVFNANGTVIARVNDGVNYVTGSSFTVTNIDTTAPTGSLAATTVTSKSVLLTATCADAQSGITKYEFSKDNGTTYLDNGTTNTYTFNSLTTGTYSFRVRCTNGSGLTAVGSTTTATASITVPTYSISPSGYATSKTVTITYPSGYTNEYSTDGGTTWTSYTTPVIFTSNGTVIARVNDGLNYVSGSSFTVTNIDTTAPTGSLASTTVTSKSVTLTATCADAQSGITKYEFSKDNGTTYLDNGTTNTYTFGSLTYGTYSFRVRCTNGSGLTVVASRSQATLALAAPTYSITPSGYSTSKTVTITYPSGYTNEYSTDGGTTWTSYTAPVVFNANGTVIARVNDGVNYVSGSSFTVTNIDTTAPTGSLASTTVTSKSVLLTATCADAQSGITKYEFSKDNGTTYLDNGTTNTYTFDSLTTGTYSFRVRCTNGSGLTVVASRSQATSAITVPTYSITPSGYATSKTVTITYPSGYTNEYSTDGGTTWTSYTAPVVFNANGTVIARVNDGVNYVTGSSFTVTNIDTTAPTGSLASTTVTSKSVLLTATCADAQSGITKYEFSKDNGTTYLDNGTTNTYTFNSLTTGTYSFRVRCTNGSGLTVVASRSQATSAITVPTYSITPSGYATSKTVTITYPSGYTNEYSTDGGTTWTSYTTPIVFNANGTVIARVNDEVNYVSGSSYTVTNIDNTAPSTPVISGGSTSYAISRTITISGVVENDSGINRYEYYLSSNSTAPTLATTGTTNGTSTTKTFNTNYAGYYVYFRAIDNVGNVGNWSSAQRLYIDINDPTILASEDPLNPAASYVRGDQVNVGGKIYRVISDDTTYVKLLANAGQFTSLNHIPNTSSTYRWSTSSVNTYLNTTIYNSLTTEIKNLIQSQNICNDPSGAGSKGGLTQAEITANGYACNGGYTTSNIRLISSLEYTALKTAIGAGDASWLFGASPGYWWTMTASTANAYSTLYIALDGTIGTLSGYDGSNNLYVSGVRPLIVMRKTSALVFNGESNDIVSTYFTINKNGNAAISGTTCIDTSNGNAPVTNTSELANGTHVISCTTTKVTGKSATATKTIYVKTDPASCPYPVGKTWTFTATGAGQAFTVPCDGRYTVEAAGSVGAPAGYRGGAYFCAFYDYSPSYPAQYGSYAYATYNYTTGTSMSLLVGTRGGGGYRGIDGCVSVSGTGGFNGGGNGWPGGGGGGGATSVLINSVVHVQAAGGRGAKYLDGDIPGAGGGPTAINTTTSHFNSSYPTYSSVATNASEGFVRITMVGLN